MVRNDSDTMVCLADKEADVTRWVDAINAAIKENAHKRQLAIEARAARGEVCFVVGGRCCIVTCGVFFWRGLERGVRD